MIRIETQLLQDYFRRDLRHAMQRGKAHDIAAAEYNLADVCNKAGRLYFHPEETPEVYFRSPLLALPAFSLDTYYKTLHAPCSCTLEATCANCVNYQTADSALHPVDADGLTAID